MLVALKAAALNHRELWVTRGLYPGMLPAPFTMGCDGAGVIEAVGAGVDARRVGEAVMLYPGLNWGTNPRFPAPQFALLGMPGPGTIAEKVNVRADSALPKPAHLTFAQAAAIPCAGLTAWRGLFVQGGLKSGEKVLVTGIGGGVALFALQFALRIGAEVYVTSGSDDTLAKAIAMGAKAGFNYKDDAWKKALTKSSGGIDVVFDGAPASSYPNYSRALNPGARVVIYGSTGGAEFAVNSPGLFPKNVSIIGTNVGNLEDFKALCAFVEQQRRLSSTNFPATGFGPEALRYLQHGHKLGKVVIAI